MLVGCAFLRGLPVQWKHRPPVLVSHILPVQHPMAVSVGLIGGLEMLSDLQCLEALPTCY